MELLLFIRRHFLLLRPGAASEAVVAAFPALHEAKALLVSILPLQRSPMELTPPGGHQLGVTSIPSLALSRWSFSKIYICAHLMVLQIAMFKEQQRNLRGLNRSGGEECMLDRQAKNK